MRTTGPEIKQPDSAFFKLARTGRFEALLKRLDDQFLVEGTGSKVEKRSYYDTFDWRLYRRKLILYRCGSRLILQSTRGRRIASVAGRKRSRYFWWDIPVGELQNQLRDCIDMRALSPVISTLSMVDLFRVMNDERKTVARIGLQQLVRDDGDEHNPLETIVVEEIRGYDTSFRNIVQHCLDLGLRKVGRHSETTRILKRSGRVPGGYGGKFDIALERTISIGDAVSIICLHLLADMERNLEGIVADIDSEFLHDFRIAVRRTRSLIDLFKKILPATVTGHFENEFKWLGTVTGPVRDIDVYLLTKNDYLNMLPPTLRPGLQLFFDELREKRIEELKRLHSHLRSPRYQSLVEDWRRFLNDKEGRLYNGQLLGSCKTCADAMIVKRCRKYIRSGNAITDASTDEKIHRLRIQGKKFRYLLEFFKSFYDESNMTVIVKQMKMLQNNLGEFNDLSVQLRLLNGRLDLLRGRSLKTIRLAAALGGLITVLDAKKMQVRNQFASTYEQVSSTPIEAMLSDMVWADARSDGADR